MLPTSVGGRAFIGAQPAPVKFTVSILPGISSSISLVNDFSPSLSASLSLGTSSVRPSVYPRYSSTPSGTNASLKYLCAHRYRAWNAARSRPPYANTAAGRLISRHLATESRLYGKEREREGETEKINGKKSRHFGNVPSDWRARAQLLSVNWFALSFPRISGITAPWEINRACPSVRACVPVCMYVCARSAIDESGCVFPSAGTFHGFGEYRRRSRKPQVQHECTARGDAECNESVVCATLVLNNNKLCWILSARPRGKRSTLNECCCGGRWRSRRENRGDTVGSLDLNS